MENKGYHTRQRESILACLRRRGDAHLTVSDILDDLRAHGDAVGQTTVYRHLDRLEREGLVRKSAAAGGRACYQYAAPGSACRRHYHLHCVSCGTLQHVDCGDLDALLDHMAREHGFVIDSFQTIFYGRCHDCAAACEEGTR